MVPEAGERTVLRLTSSSPHTTEAVGEFVGARLGAGDLIALDGELGAGKTCFVRGLAAGLGVTEPVQSPTYTLMHTYAGRLPVYHLDAWMEGREKAFLAEGGADWLEHDGVAVVEWAARVADWLPLPRLAVQLRHPGGGAEPSPEGGESEDRGRRDLRLSLLGGALSSAPAAEEGERLSRLQALLAALEVDLGAIPGLERRKA